MLQKGVFLQAEGDAWYERNRGKIEVAKDLLPGVFERLQIAPRRILEIGCSDGTRLDNLARLTGAECYGIDPSLAAIEDGRRRYPNISLEQGTADDTGFESGAFDVIIFGFCLYLCDPADHFRIAYEGDRLLRDKGTLIIKDFCTPSPYRNPYSHLDGVYSYKMEFARMFLWHPSYRLLMRGYQECADSFCHAPDQMVSVDVLRKDTGCAFPANPFGG